MQSLSIAQQFGRESISGMELNCLIDSVITGVFYDHQNDEADPEVYHAGGHCGYRADNQAALKSLNGYYFKLCLSCKMNADDRVVMCSVLRHCYVWGNEAGREAALRHKAVELNDQMMLL